MKNLCLIALSLIAINAHADYTVNDFNQNVYEQQQLANQQRELANEQTAMRIAQTNEQTQQWEMNH